MTDKRLDTNKLDSSKLMFKLNKLKSINQTLLDSKQVAELLNLKEGSLSVWRCTKRHPLKYVKIGRLVRYRLSDIEEFLNNNTYLSEVKNDK